MENKKLKKQSVRQNSNKKLPSGLSYTKKVQIEESVGI